MLILKIFKGNYNIFDSVTLENNFTLFCSDRGYWEPMIECKHMYTQEAE